MRCESCSSDIDNHSPSKGKQWLRVTAHPSEDVLLSDRRQDACTRINRAIMRGAPVEPEHTRLEAVHMAAAGDIAHDVHQLDVER